jgi:hypothetical protein
MTSQALQELEVRLLNPDSASLVVDRLSQLNLLAMMSWLRERQLSSRAPTFDASLSECIRVAIRPAENPPSLEESLEMQMQGRLSEIEVMRMTGMWRFELVRRVFGVGVLVGHEAQKRLRLMRSHPNQISIEAAADRLPFLPWELVRNHAEARRAGDTIGVRLLQLEPRLLPILIACKRMESASGHGCHRESGGSSLLACLVAGMMAAGLKLAHEPHEHPGCECERPF